MAFGNASLPTRKYVYGVRGTVPGKSDDMGKPLKFPGHDACVGQLFAAHAFQNRLVEIELERRRLASEIIHTRTPDLADLLAAAERLRAEAAAMRTDLKRLNADARSRSGRPEHKEPIREKAAESATAWRAYGAAKTAAYADPTVRAALADNDAAAVFAVADARNQAVAGLPAREATAERQGCGPVPPLYWATTLQVCQRVKKSGPPPRFKRWMGEGVISVQFQRKADKESPRVPVLDAQGAQRIGRNGRPVMRHEGGSSLLAADAELRNTICYIERKPGHLKHATVHFRIGSGEKGVPIWAALPAVIHRPLPTGAEVKWVHLSRRKIGTHFKWEVHFDVAMAAAAWAVHDGIRDEVRGRERSESGTVAVSLGWRLIDGEVRVAYWVGDDGEEGEVIVPRERVAAWLRCDSLRSTRDLLFEESKADLWAWLATQTLPPEWKARTASLRQWRGAARLAALVIWWRAHRLPGDGAILNRMEGELITPALGVNSSDSRTVSRPYYSGGRKQDKHLLDWSENLRSKCAGWRKWYYREFALALAGRYKNVVVAEIDWHVIAEKPEPESGDEEVNKRYRGIAACASLRDQLTDVMNEVAVPAPGITLTCHACGASCQPPGRGMWITCEGCGGERIDRAFNAAKNLLSRALGGPVGSSHARVI